MANESITPMEREEIISKIREALGSSSSVSYIESPLTDQDFINEVTGRAKEFNFAGTPTSISIDSENVMNIGANDVNDSLTATPIDLTNSKQLTDILSERFGYEVNRETANASFVNRKTFSSSMSKERGVPVISSREFVLITSYGGQKLDKTISHYDFSFHILDKQDLTMQYRSRLSPSIMPITFIEPVVHQSERETGYYNKLAIREGGQWKDATYTIVDSMAVAREESRTEDRGIFEPDEYEVIELQNRELRTNAPVPPSPPSNRGNSRTEAARDDIPLLVTVGDSEFYGPTTGPGLTEAGDSPADPGISTTAPPPAGAVQYYGPPSGVVKAYYCSGFSTPGECVQCCQPTLDRALTWTASSMAFQWLVGCVSLATPAAAFWCGLISGFAGASVAIVALWGYNACRANCKRTYWHRPGM